MRLHRCFGGCFTNRVFFSNKYAQEEANSQVLRNFSQRVSNIGGKSKSGTGVNGGITYEKLQECLTTILKTVIIGFPIALTFRDSCFSTYRIHGDSMDPTLEDGDVVLVRKADFFPYFRRRWLEENDPTNNDGTKELGDDNRNNRTTVSVEEHLRHMDTVDWSRDGCTYNSSDSLFLSCPPRIVPGHVIVFKSPSHEFQYHIKRLVAHEGQRFRPRRSPRSVETLHNNSVWVEGDNAPKSVDSNHFGPLNRQLIVGQAEYILWPPSRFGKIRRVEPHVGRVWWP